MRAFSLVELSIVLVILGLLTGGILAGQSLIRAAEIRSIPEQYSRIAAAIFTFRDKYRAIPGDMPNATQFWGVANADPSLCTTTNSRTLSDPKQTCDGNGDGRASQNASTAIYERFRFWQHLANAGLIEGSYSGIADSGSTSDATPGFNAPAGKLSNSGFSQQYQYTVPTALMGTEIPWKHIIYYGGDRSTGNTFGPILTPAEAWSIDTKLDDGKPGYGNTQAARASFVDAPNCTTTDDAATSLYNITDNQKLCGLAFSPGY